MPYRQRRNVTLTDTAWERLVALSHEHGFDSASRMIEWLVKQEWERAVRPDSPLPRPFPARGRPPKPRERG
jgi:hypothetical protein